MEAAGGAVGERAQRAARLVFGRADIEVAAKLDAEARIASPSRSGATAKRP